MASAPGEKLLRRRATGCWGPFFANRSAGACFSHPPTCSLPLLRHRLTNNLTQTQACDYLTLLYFGLTGGGDTSPPECNATEAVAYQTMPVGGLTQLADARPLPLAFPDPEEIFAVEGASYYFLYDLARNAQTYTPCGNDPSAKLVLPPGWELDRTADLTYPNGPPLPIVFVLSNAETNQLLFLVRPTVGSREWSLNFAYNHTDDPAAQELFGDAQLSEGFSSIFFEVGPCSLLFADTCLWATAAVFVSGIWRQAVALACLPAHKQRRCVGRQPMCLPTDPLGPLLTPSPPSLPYLPTPWQAWPTVQSALEELVVNATATPEVWVAGYSMGAAVSMLAAFAGQDLLDTQMGEEASGLCQGRALLGMLGRGGRQRVPGGCRLRLLAWKGPQHATPRQQACRLLNNPLLHPTCCILPPEIHAGACHQFRHLLTTPGG